MFDVRRNALACAMAVLAGCYSYVPARPEAVPPGTAVRARITVEEAARLSEALGREDRVIMGKLLGEKDGGFLVSVPSVYRPVGLGAQRFNQEVAIPPAELVEVEIRKLDRWRTGGVIAAGVALGGLLVYTQFQDDNPTQGNGGSKNGGNLIVVPVHIGF